MGGRVGVSKGDEEIRFERNIFDGRNYLDVESDKSARKQSTVRAFIFYRRAIEMLDYY